MLCSSGEMSFDCPILVEPDHLRATSYRGFEQLRGEGLARLRELIGEDDLDRAGRHPELGEVSMRQLLATWSVHDLDHVAQIYAALAGNYDTAVGPWNAYLGILLRRDRS